MKRDSILGMCVITCENHVAKNEVNHLCTNAHCALHNYKRKGFNNQDSTAISRLGGFQNSQTTGTLLEVQLAASGIFEQSLLVASYPL